MSTKELEQHKVRWVVQNGFYMAPGDLDADRLLHQIVEINTKLSKSKLSEGPSQI